MNEEEINESEFTEEELKKIPFKKRVTMAQNKIKAPKNQYNSFSNYKYRSAEGILESVKPFNDKFGLTLSLSDTVEKIDYRFYIKATARLLDSYSDEYIESYGYAREQEKKKGQDASQITGGASSYARKYALNGLYLIDDTKEDPDMQKPPQEKQYKEQQPPKQQRQQQSQQPKQQAEQQPAPQNNGTFEQRVEQDRQRLIALDRAHGADEGTAFGWVKQQMANQGLPIQNFTTDVKPENILRVEQLISMLESR